MNTSPKISDKMNPPSKFQNTPYQRNESKQQSEAKLKLIAQTFMTLKNHCSLLKKMESPDLLTTLKYTPLSQINAPILGRSIDSLVDLMKRGITGRNDELAIRISMAYHPKPKVIHNAQRYPEDEYESVTDDDVLISTLKTYLDKKSQKHFEIGSMMNIVLKRIESDTPKMLFNFENYNYANAPLSAEVY